MSTLSMLSTLPFFPEVSPSKIPLNNLLSLLILPYPPPLNC